MQLNSTIGNLECYIVKKSIQNLLSSLVGTKCVTLIGTENYDFII